jgi:hypothetical protein
VKSRVFFGLSGSREIIRSIHAGAKDFSNAFLSSCGRFSHATFEGRAHVEADDDHNRNRVIVDPPEPEFQARMVPAMHGRGGDDRAGEYRSDIEPTKDSTGGVP